MVRVGGLKYSLDPTQKIGNRISDLELDGQPLDANKNYPVGGWAMSRLLLKASRSGKSSQITCVIRKLSEMWNLISQIEGVENNPGIVL